MTKDELIEKIVMLEWQAFDKVKNEGGRADCQDDWNTFQIMRKSQYMAWNEELLDSWYHDLITAEEDGLNVITLKYGYMMQSTAPEEFEKIKDKMPQFTEEKVQLVKQIASIQVGWMEEFAAKFPLLAANARSVHSGEDNRYNTSSETYLKGELMTYSDITLKLYGRFIVDIARSGGNLARMIIENTVHLYGYESLEQAEAALGK